MPHPPSPQKPKPERAKLMVQTSAAATWGLLAAASSFEAIVSTYPLQAPRRAPRASGRCAPKTQLFVASSVFARKFSISSIRWRLFAQSAVPRRELTSPSAAHTNTTATSLRILFEPASQRPNFWGCLRKPRHANWDLMPGVLGPLP